MCIRDRLGSVTVVLGSTVKEPNLKEPNLKQPVKQTFIDPENHTSYSIKKLKQSISTFECFGAVGQPDGSVFSKIKHETESNSKLDFLRLWLSQMAEKVVGNLPSHFPRPIVIPSADSMPFGVLAAEPQTEKKKKDESKKGEFESTRMCGGLGMLPTDKAFLKLIAFAMLRFENVLEEFDSPQEICEEHQKLFRQVQWRMRHESGRVHGKVAACFNEFWRVDRVDGVTTAENACAEENEDSGGGARVRSRGRGRGSG